MSYSAGAIAELCDRWKEPAVIYGTTLKRRSMLTGMQETEASWSKILTAVLGVLGFVISCYNYMRLTRKDKEERQSQLWQARTELNERRQEAVTLLMSIQVSTEHNRKVLKDVLEEAERSGRADVVQTLKVPLAEFERDTSEVGAMVKDILASIPPAGASAEDIQKLMAIYDEKALVGLKMRQSHVEEYSKRVSAVVELAEKAIRAK